MEKIVEHLVTKHGCKTLNYVGGPVWNSENKEGLSAYCDVLKRHGIEVEEQRSIHKDYEIDTGEWGFDDFDKACIYEPRITTVGFTKENIAYKAMGLLDQIWSGSKSTERLFYVDVQWVFQGAAL